MILDGLVSGACAMVAHRVAYRAAKWWQAGHRSVEPAHEYVLARLQLEPLLDYQLRLGEGTGALLALPILRAAQATLAEMATFDEAGVSDRPHDDVRPKTLDDEASGRRARRRRGVAVLRRRPAVARHVERAPGRSPDRPLTDAPGVRRWRLHRSSDSSSGASPGLVRFGVTELSDAPLLGAVTGVAALAVLTRGLHLDGLADVADGLGSGRPPEQAREVMKRSDIGPFGVVTLLLVASRAGGLARAASVDVGRGPRPLLRSSALPWSVGPPWRHLSCRGVSAASPEGLGGAGGRVPVPFGCPGRRRGLGGAGRRWRQPSPRPRRSPRSRSAPPLPSLVAEVWRRHCSRRFGGITGDVLGSVEQVAFTAFLVWLCSCSCPSPGALSAGLGQRGEASTNGGRTTVIVEGRPRTSTVTSAPSATSAPRRAAPDRSRLASVGENVPLVTSPITAPAASLTSMCGRGMPRSVARSPHSRRARTGLLLGQQRLASGEVRLAPPDRPAGARLHRRDRRPRGPARAAGSPSRCAACRGHRARPGVPPRRRRPRPSASQSAGVAPQVGSSSYPRSPVYPVRQTVSGLPANCASTNAM